MTPRPVPIRCAGCGRPCVYLASEPRPTAPVRCTACAALASAHLACVARPDGTVRVLSPREAEAERIEAASRAERERKRLAERARRKARGL